jgi:hypothetical protein
MKRGGPFLARPVRRKWGFFFPSLQDAPNSIPRQADSLVPYHRFADCPAAVQSVCKSRNNFTRLWINIDLATICISRYAQVRKELLHQ